MDNYIVSIKDHCDIQEINKQYLFLITQPKYIQYYLNIILLLSEVKNRFSETSLIATICLYYFMVLLKVK